MNPRRWLLSLGMALSLAIPGAGPVGAAATPTATSSSASLNINHFYVIMEENTNYEDVVGNTADTPYINSLINQYGFAANYYGVTHPSEPNYLATIGGDFYGLHADDPSFRTDALNLVDQLTGQGKTWATYQQSMPSVGFLGAQYPDTGSGLYVAKHNPFVLFNDIRNDPKRLENVKPADMLASDLATGVAPNFTFIAPDECHDFHGVGNGAAYGMPWCSYPPNFTINHQLFQYSDAYLKTLVTTIMSSKAWTSDSAIVVTWDENESSGTRSPNRGYASSTGCCGSPVGDGGGRVPTIVITANGGHTVSLNPYNHYSLLKTVQTAFGLGCLANTCSSAVQPMTDLFQPSASTPIPTALTQGVAVTFTSKNPGNGQVLFGQGPGCFGLVNTATRDLGAGTTTHTVLVTGNDEPGSVGNVGLTPGMTYWYEVVNVSSAGNEVDNNGGKCYAFTVSKP